MQKYWPLRFIALVFAIPILGAMYLLYDTNALAFNMVQHGSLIQPAKQLQSASIIPNKWNVLYVPPHDIQALANLHIALGADKDRVAIIKADDNILHLRPKPGSILLVDPAGFYIMSYAPAASLSGLLKDLKRLLKYSHA